MAAIDAERSLRDVSKSSRSGDEHLEKARESSNVPVSKSVAPCDDGNLEKNPMNDVQSPERGSPAKRSARRLSADSPNSKGKSFSEGSQVSRMPGILRNVQRATIKLDKKRRHTKKLNSEYKSKDEFDETAALEAAKRAIREEENSIRTSAEVTQLELIFIDIFCSEDQELKRPIRVLPFHRPRPLLQYFQSCVHRIVESNRTWCLQLKVQRLVSGTLMDAVQPHIKNSMRSREEILQSVQDSQNYWENIAAADRCTSMLVVPMPQDSGQYTNGDIDDAEVVAPPREPRPQPPPFAREYSTLRQYATRLWPSDVRRAGGMRSCPGTKDGAQRAADFQNYLDLLLFEQDRQSAMQNGVLGCSAGFLKSRSSKLAPSLDSVAEDAAVPLPKVDDLGSSTSSFGALSRGKSSPRNTGGSGAFSTRQLRSSRGLDKDDEWSRKRSRGTPPHPVDPGHLDMHLPPLQGSSFLPREGADREMQNAAAAGTSEHLPPIKDGSRSRSTGFAGFTYKRSAVYKNVLQELNGARPAAAPARPSRSTADAPSGNHAPLFNPLPQLVRLNGCPLRRRGQARILSEFTPDRILAEFGGDIAVPEDNECRPEVLYFRRCNEMSIMPSKLEFLFEEQEEEIQLSNVGLTDEHMQALGNAFSQKAPNLQVLDLSENRLLTDASLQPTILRLTPLASGLRVLHLGGTQLGASTIKVLAQAMVTRFQLEDLSLQRVPVPDTMWQVLCQAIVKAGNLTKLDVSDSQCGRWQQTPCIQLSQMFMELPSLKAADLSNNYFRRQGLSELGKAVSHPRFRLEALSLNDNAWTDTEAIVGGVLHPMVAFCEQIRYNKSLQRLGLRRSQVDVMAAYCLEDSILGHPRLQELQVEGNPFGEYGLRALLRSLLQKTSPLEIISITEFRDISVKPSILFNYGDLTEDYMDTQALNLSCPYHRAVLRLILRRTEDFQQPPMACLHKLMIDGRRPDQCPFHKDSAGLWTIPTSGKLQFSLVLTVPPGTRSADEFLQRWQMARRLPVGVSKFMFLHRTWLSLESDRERRLFIEALAKECTMKLAHLRIFADEVKRSMPNLLSVVVSGLALAMPLVHRACINSALVSGHLLYKNSHMGATVNPNADKERRQSVDDNGASLPQEMQEMRPRKEALTWLRKLMLFNPGNPNGKYDLDLSNPMEYTVAERVLLVATWEARTAKAQGCQDLSEPGDFNAIRNFSVNGVDVKHTLDWQLPGDGYSAEGWIIFDYVSLRRPKAGDPTISEKAFAQLDFFLKGHKSKDMDLLESSVFFSILKASLNEVWSAEQLAGIISFTLNPERRRDLFCALFTRCRDLGPPLVDLYTGVIGFQPGLLPGLFTLEDRLLIRDRIGYINTLDWVHLHETPLNRLRLNLAMKDARTICASILELADIEPGVNMVETHWTGLRSKNLVAWSPPADWKETLPEHGIFEITYVLEKPQFLREQARRRIAEQIQWPHTENEADYLDFGSEGEQSESKKDDGVVKVSLEEEVVASTAVHV